MSSFDYDHEVHALMSKINAIIDDSVLDDVAMHLDRLMRCALQADHGMQRDEAIRWSQYINGVLRTELERINNRMLQQDILDHDTNPWIIPLPGVEESLRCCNPELAAEAIGNVIAKYTRDWVFDRKQERRAPDSFVTRGKGPTRADDANRHSKCVASEIIGARLVQWGREVCDVAEIGEFRASNYIAPNKTEKVDEEPTSGVTFLS